MIAKLREVGDRHLLAELQLTFGYSLFNFSEYREALRSAVESFAIHLKGREENPYLISNFKVHEHLAISCLLFAGEWGEEFRWPLIVVALVSIMLLATWFAVVGKAQQTFV